MPINLPRFKEGTSSRTGGRPAIAAAVLMLLVSCSRGSVLCAGCAASPAGAPALPAPGDGSLCGQCARPVTWGSIAAKKLKEVSGVAASSMHPGVFYVHNDSGDSPRFFAVDEHGGDLGTFNVSGAVAVDWEDVARGPCPAGSCLYFADMGDNEEARSSYAIYRVTEPDALGAGMHTVTAEAFPWSYPDGSHDAEVLLVHPETGAITVVLKGKKHTRLPSIYEQPLPLTPGAIMRYVGEAVVPADITRLTGGSVHPLARGVVLRNHTTVLYYPMSAGQSVAQALLATPCAFPADAEKGEAITWTSSGDGFVSISEGKRSPLNFVSCPH